MKRNQFSPIIAILTLLICLVGCEKSDVEAVSDYLYYPLEAQRPWIYEVEETIYTAGSTTPQINTWHEKHEIVRSSVSDQNSTTYTVVLSIRDINSSTWRKTKEYQLIRYPDKLLKSLDNKITVPLIFPVDARSSWDLNTYNTSDPSISENCYYENIGKAITLDDITYNNTVQVVNKDFRNDEVVQYLYAYTQYASGIGPIYIEDTEYYYCTNNNCINQKIIESGFSIKKKLIDY